MLGVDVDGRWYVSKERDQDGMVRVESWGDGLFDWVKTLGLDKKLCVGVRGRYVGSRHGGGVSLCP